MKTEKNKKGVTLIEMIIAMMIMSIVLTGTLTMINLARRSSKASRDMARMTLRANTEIERIRAMPSNEIRPAVYPLTNAGDDKTTGIVSIRAFEKTPLYEVTINIQRTTSQGSRKVVFNTLLHGEAKP